MQDYETDQFNDLKNLLSAIDIQSFGVMAKNLNLLIIVLDKELKLVFGNKIFFEFAGCKQEEVIGQDYVDNFIPAEMRLVVRSTLREIMYQNRTNYSGSNQVKTCNRGVRFVEWNSIHLRSDSGGTEGMLCIGMDITEHNILKNTLNRIDVEKNQILNNISELIVFHDGNGIINWANRAFIDAVGISWHAVIGSSCKELFHRVQQTTPDCYVKRALYTEGLEEIIELLDGSRWLSKSLLFEEDGIYSRQTIMVMTPLIEKPPQNQNTFSSETAKKGSLLVMKSGSDVIEHGIGVFSESMKEVMRQAEIIHSDRSVPVLIEGETGTGKELVARYVHFGKEGSTSPFIAINCAAITPTIFESELFGYEGGAFTGGRSGGQKGKLDIANGGTLFLDEIGEIPVSIQAKLLRVIQEKEYYRVGGLKRKEADVRLLCATNINLEEGMKEGTFRSDLYYRLEAVRLTIPPLRDRKDDILPLARMFLVSMTKQKGKRFKTITKDAAKLLYDYSWPGNVRQLHNVIERVVLMWDDTELKPEHLNFLDFQPKVNMTETGNDGVEFSLEDIKLPQDHLDLKAFNAAVIKKALEINNGNKTQTALYLGMSRRALGYRLRQIGVE